jgi:hypothetical protein
MLTVPAPNAVRDSIFRALRRESKSGEFEVSMMFPKINHAIHFGDANGQLSRFHFPESDINAQAESELLASPYPRGDPLQPFDLLQCIRMVSR